MSAPKISTRTLPISLPDATLIGDLSLPANPSGLILFAHGSGSSRRSPRNRQVAEALNAAGFATLLTDLLTEHEAQDSQARFDIPLLGRRLVGLIDAAAGLPGCAQLPIGLFGASTGAAAALIGAAERRSVVDAVVSRGGRPDLAGPTVLGRVATPTLLLVGSADSGVIELNELAALLIRAPKRLELVPGATHLFEEPGTLEQVAARAGQWFAEHLDGGQGLQRAS